MKLAILSESPADEAAIRVLISSLLPRAELLHPGLRARGWPSVAQVLPAVLRHLHFNTEADGLVVVVDADDSVVHDEEHERPGYFHPLCRICKLRAVFRQTLKKLPVSETSRRLRRGVGVAVPAIEAWYLCAQVAGVTEENWVRGQAEGRLPYTRAELKLRTYGTDRPSLEHEVRVALKAAERFAKDCRRLENDFPGFGYLAADLREWTVPETEKPLL